MKFNLFIAVLFFTVSSNAQSLEKVVFDKENKMPVVFASVYTANKSGVITNQEGGFKLNISNLSLTDSLYFSSLGYENKALTLKAIQDLRSDTIFLKVQQEMLEEVVVSNENLSVEQIIQRFKDSLVSNHTISPSKFRLFNRSKTTYTPVETGIELDRSSFMTKAKRKRFNQKVDAYFTKIKGKTSTSFTDALFDAFYFKDSTGINHIKTTYLINEEEDNSMENIQEEVFKELIDALDKETSFKVRSGIIPVEDSLSTKEFITEDNPEKKDTIKNDFYRYSYANIIQKSQNLANLDFIEDSKKYEFSLDNTSFFNGEIVYVINFKPKRGSSKYEGTAYINAEDYGLLKLDYNLVEGEKEMGVNLKFLLGVKFRVDGSKFQYLFKRTEDGKYYPYVYKSSAKNYVYFDRSFVFKENNEDRDERIKFKLSLLVESNSISEEEYLVLRASEIDPDTDYGFDENGYIFREYLDQYDPNIWQDYDVIQATQEIKDYNK